MPDFLYFLFDTAAQLRIDPASVIAEDVPYAAGFTSGQAQPQSWRLRFTVTDPANGPLTLRPMVPGHAVFLADTGSGFVPLPDDVTINSDEAVAAAQYDTWAKTGVLMVKPCDKGVSSDFASLAASLEVIPNRMWYEPVTIPLAFLNESLLDGLDKAHVCEDSALGKIVAPPGNRWRQLAVSGFLNGTYAPKLNRASLLRPHDDIVTFPMPTVVMDANGQVELVVTMALNQAAQDGTEAQWNDPLLNTPVLVETDPAHARNGLVPARHVYRSLQNELIDRGTSGSAAFADVVLADWPKAPRYFPIRFTRTWQPVPNCSISFLEQTVVVKDAANFVLAEQRLPVHGMFYLSQDPLGANPPPPAITVSLSGGMRFLDGATPSVWKLKGGLTPLTFDLSTGTIPHVVTRRLMTEVLLLEPLTRTDDANCVFNSMRRSIRAWIDNRISGGRLIHRDPKMLAGTGISIEQALGATTRASVCPFGPAANWAKDPDLTNALLEMERIMGLLFPDAAPAFTVEGTNHRDTVYSMGEMAWNLWISRVKAFDENATKCNFDPAHVGRGAAGAVVALGLGQYHVYPAPAATNPPEIDYFNTNVGRMLNGGLLPGAMLQFWSFSSDFEKMITLKQDPDVPILGVGHSPIFFGLLSADDGGPGMNVIDQHPGITPCIVLDTAPSAGKLDWDGFEPELWIAANWDE